MDLGIATAGFGFQGLPGDRYYSGNTAPVFSGAVRRELRRGWNSRSSARSNDPPRYHATPTGNTRFTPTLGTTYPSATDSVRQEHSDVTRTRSRLPCYQKLIKVLKSPLSTKRPKKVKKHEKAKSPKQLKFSKSHGPASREPEHPDPINVDTEREPVPFAARHTSTQEWVAHHADEIRAIESTIAELDQQIQNANWEIEHGELEIKHRQEVKALMEKQLKEKKEAEKEKKKLLKKDKPPGRGSLFGFGANSGHDRGNSKESPKPKAAPEQPIPEQPLPSSAVPLSSVPGTPASPSTVPTLVVLVEETP